MEDRTLKERVERELEWDPAIDASRVGVTVTAVEDHIRIGMRGVPTPGRHS
ncbi:hypothetical protein [Phenylobacterium sp.]|uniref:hypothetical protein n=1 Tax=Phenylobacterium sp. TaxID=1871053 RepID=UPI00286B2F12|nr:hypothetical protein [Phenylobacterium sp.]